LISNNPRQTAPKYIAAVRLLAKKGSRNVLIALSQHYSTFELGLVPPENLATSNPYEQELLAANIPPQNIPRECNPRDTKSSHSSRLITPAVTPVWTSKGKEHAEPYSIDPEPPAIIPSTSEVSQLPPFLQALQLGRIKTPLVIKLNPTAKTGVTPPKGLAAKPVDESIVIKPSIKKVSPTDTADSPRRGLSAFSQLDSVIPSQPVTKPSIPSRIRIVCTPKGTTKTAYIPVNAPIDTYWLPELLDLEIVQEHLPYYYNLNLGQVLVSPSVILYPEPQSELPKNPSTSKDLIQEKSPSWEDKNTPLDSGIPQLKDLSHQLSQQLGFKPPPKSELIPKQQAHRIQCIIDPDAEEVPTWRKVATLTTKLVIPPTIPDSNTLVYPLPPPPPPPPPPPVQHPQPRIVTTLQTQSQTHQVWIPGDQGPPKVNITL
jgi:hypothetical protein